MLIVYMDDSKDQVLGVFSAIMIPQKEWFDIFGKLKTFRQYLKNIEGIYMNKELHATDFVGGRGNISSRVVPKGRRCEIFKELLQLTATLNVAIMNAVYPPTKDDWAF